MRRIRITGMTQLVSVVALIAGVCMLAALLISSCRVISGLGLIGDPIFHQRMSKFVPEFDRLNDDVYAQLPDYPGAQEVNILRGGVHDPLVATPRTLSVFYVSADDALSVYELLKKELLSQEWYMWQEEDYLVPDRFTARFRKDNTCLLVAVRSWDINGTTFTGYEPDPFDLEPVSWYWLDIQHALEAVPGAPVPPDMTLFTCRSPQE